VTPALASICAELGVKVVPNERSRTRRAGETCATKTLDKIFSSHGAGHTTLLLKTFVETENNGRELVGPLMYAVSDIIEDYPEWTETTKWFDAFDTADLAKIWARAKSIRRVPRRFSAKTLLTEYLRDSLGESHVDA
jgi:hypothetical protein